MKINIDAIEARLNAATPKDEAEFLNGAPTYVAALIAEVRRLTAERDACFDSMEAALFDALGAPTEAEREAAANRVLRHRGTTADAEVSGLSISWEGLVARVRQLRAELNFWRSLCEVSVAPWTAGPPVEDPNAEYDETKPEGVRLRARVLRILIWHFAKLAAQHPAPNFLAFDFSFPDTLTPNGLAAADLPPEMADLAGYHLEIAAVKPGGKGPSRMREQVQAELDRVVAEREALNEALDWATGSETAGDAASLVNRARASRGHYLHERRQRREAEQERDALRVALKRAEAQCQALAEAPDEQALLDHDNVAHVLDGFLPDAATPLAHRVATLRARLDRAEKELRCERGEWAPEGWERDGVGWRRENPLREARGSSPGQWYYYDEPNRRHGPYSGPYAAIEAADTTLKEDK